MKWNLWRGVLAGAMIGFLEAAGLDPARPGLRNPLRVVRLDDRDVTDPLALTGLMILDPLPDPRPRRSDFRRLLGPAGLSVTRFR